MTPACELPVFLSAWGTSPPRSASVATGTCSAWTDAPAPAAADSWTQSSVVCTCRVSWTAPGLWKQSKSIHRVAKECSLPHKIEWKKLWRFGNKCVEFCSKTSLSITVEYSFLPELQGRPHMNIFTGEDICHFILNKSAETGRNKNGSIWWANSMSPVGFTLRRNFPTVHYLSILAPLRNGNTWWQPLYFAGKSSCAKIIFNAFYKTHYRHCHLFCSLLVPFCRLVALQPCILRAYFLPHPQLIKYNKFNWNCAETSTYN